MLKEFRKIFFVVFCCSMQGVHSDNVEKFGTRDRNGSVVRWASLGDGITYFATYTHFDEKQMRGEQNSVDSWEVKNNYGGWSGLVDQGFVSPQTEFFYNGSCFWMHSPEKNMSYRASRYRSEIVVSKDCSGLEKSFENKDLALFLRTRQVCYNAIPRRKGRL